MHALLGNRGDAFGFLRGAALAFSDLYRYSRFRGAWRTIVRDTLDRPALVAAANLDNPLSVARRTAAGTSDALSPHQLCRTTPPLAPCRSLLPARRCSNQLLRESLARCQKRKPELGVVAVAKPPEQPRVNRAPGRQPRSQDSWVSSEHALDLTSNTSAQRRWQLARRESALVQVPTRGRRAPSVNKAFAVGSCKDSLVPIQARDPLAEDSVEAGRRLLEIERSRSTLFGFRPLRSISSESTGRSGPAAQFVGGTSRRSRLSAVVSCASYYASRGCRRRRRSSALEILDPEQDGLVEAPAARTAEHHLGTGWSRRRTRPPSLPPHCSSIA